MAGSVNVGPAKPGGVGIVVPGHGHGRQGRPDAAWYMLYVKSLIE
jgi:hypothetical protein